MAYVSPEKKAKALALVKVALPKGWRVTLAVRHHSAIVATIRQAPAHVLEDIKADDELQWSRSEESAARAREGLPTGRYVDYADRMESIFKDRTQRVLDALHKAINVDNHDRSDIQTDYFDVGHYTTLQFGEYDKPCVFA